MVKSLTTRSEIMRETVAQWRARGFSWRAAVRKAGYVDIASATQAVCTDPRVQSRVDAIINAAADDTVASVNEILQKLTGMLRADVADVLDYRQRPPPKPDDIDPPEPGGIIVSDLNDWPQGNIDRLESIKIDKDGNPEFKLTSTIAVIDRFMDIYGLRKNTLTLDMLETNDNSILEGDKDVNVLKEMYKISAGKI